MLGLTVVRAYTSLNASVKVTFALNSYLTVSVIRGNHCRSLTSSFIDSENHFRAHYTPTIHPETASALKISRFQTNRKILDASSLTDALRGCDTYACEKVLRGPLSLAQVNSFLFWHPCSYSTQAYRAQQSGGKGQRLLPRNCSWPRGGDMLTSPCKISTTPQALIRSRRG